MEKAYQLEQKAKSRKIEEERKERMEKLNLRRAHLQNEQKATHEALNTIQKSGEQASEVDNFNDSVEVLRELKDDAMDKFSVVVDHLETAITVTEKEILAKNSVEDLKSLVKKVEAQLDAMGKKSGDLEQSQDISQAIDITQLVMEWINYFHVKVTDAGKRESMKIQYEELKENLDFMKENGGDEATNKDLELMVNQFKTRLENIKPSRWEQRHVDNLKETMNCFSDAIDQIGFAGSDLQEVIKKLMLNSSQMMALE